MDTDMVLREASLELPAKREPMWGNLGWEIMRLRMIKGWNQKTLAKHASLSPSYIPQIEAGHRKPQAGTLYKLANALGVDIEYLVQYIVPPKRPVAQRS